YPRIGAGHHDIPAGGGIELTCVLAGGEDPGECGGNEDAGNEQDERARKPPGAEGHAVRQTRRTGCTLPQAIDSSIPKLMVPQAVVCACRAASVSEAAEAVALSIRPRKSTTTKHSAVWLASVP